MGSNHLVPYWPCFCYEIKYNVQMTVDARLSVALRLSSHMRCPQHMNPSCMKISNVCPEGGSEMVRLPEKMVLCINEVSHFLFELTETSLDCSINIGSRKRPSLPLIIALKEHRFQAVYPKVWCFMLLSMELPPARSLFVVDRRVYCFHRKRSSSVRLFPCLHHGFQDQIAGDYS